MSDTGSPTGTEAGPESRRWARVAVGKPAVMSRTDNVSYGAEQYRNLAFQVEQYKPGGQKCLVVALSSPDPGAGKTLTSLNLSLTLARESEQRVLLVEGDMWKPTMRDYLEIPDGTAGLAQILAGEHTIDEVTTTIWGTHLDVIFAGELGRKTGLMAHQRLSRAIEEMRSSYDFVILDSPPIVLASGRGLAACADTVVGVVRSGKTKRRGIEEALTVLGPNKVLGFVLNGARLTSGRGYAYYSGYARQTPLEERQLTENRKKRIRRIVGGVLAAAVSIAAGLWMLKSDRAPVEELPELTEATPIAESDGFESMAAPNGLESGFVTDLVDGARAAAESVTSYDLAYSQLDFPGGDPGLDRGTAADLVVRAFRRGGIDLQQEVNEDLRDSPNAYGATEPDPNIDHRRVRNLMTFFERRGESLDSALSSDWRPGDLVFWSTDRPGRVNHVGVVSDRRAVSGNWMVIHHFKGSTSGAGSEEDALALWSVEGHYRWTSAEGG